MTWPGRPEESEELVSFIMIRRARGSGDRKWRQRKVDSWCVAESNGIAQGPGGLGLQILGRGQLAAHGSCATKEGGASRHATITVLLVLKQ